MALKRQIIRHLLSTVISQVIKVVSMPSRTSQSSTEDWPLSKGLEHSKMKFKGHRLAVKSMDFSASF